MEDFQKEINKANELRKANIYNSFSNSDDLIKGKGEGSKGGKVIGHTKSGKPIYDTLNHSSHEHFTKEDRSDAVRHFGKKAHEKELHKKVAESNKKSDKIKKDMSAGAVTGTDTTNQPSSGASVKQESLFGVKKKKPKY